MILDSSIILSISLLGIVHPGVQHPCTKTSRNENIVESLTRDLSPDGTRRVAAKLVNELRMNNNTGKKGDSLDLPSGSQNLHITFGQPPAKKQFSREAMVKLKTQGNFSSNQCKTLAQALRVELGRKAVEPGLMEELSQVKHRLADFLRVEEVDMTYKKGENITITPHPLLCLDDLGTLLLTVCEVRDLDPEDAVITVGVDDGQQSLKVDIHINHFFIICLLMTLKLQKTFSLNCLLKIAKMLNDDTLLSSLHSKIFPSLPCIGPSIDFQS